MTKKQFTVHGHSGAPNKASLRLPEPVLVMARAVALVDGVSVEDLVANLISERGRALGLAALTDAAESGDAQ